MGVATHHFPRDRPPTEKERVAAVRAALRDGTVVRVRALMGWTRADLAERLNVLPSLVTAWEEGEMEPSPYASGKLWTVLVCAVRYEDTHTDEPPTLPVP